jgi:hypothetical protein
VFVIPSAPVKNKTDRLVVLNDVAKSVIDYSAAEITTLIEAANKVCQEPSRKNPALLLLRRAGTHGSAGKLVEREGNRTPIPAL